MKQERIYLSCPTIHGEEQKYVQEAFDTNWVAPLGPNVDLLEKEISDYVGVGYAAALSAGTAAIHLALKLLEVKQDDVVFVSSLTFSATVNPIAYEKAMPVFIDAEPDTWNMSPEALKRAFETYPHVKAVICVHLYGTPAKMDEILALCQEYNVPLIEDAAESLGATYQGKQTGSMGEFGIFSFNGNKIITTSGGGMLVSPQKDRITKARFLATQARDQARHYQHSQIGYNYRMSNVVAGIGRGQMLHLEEHIQLKKHIYEEYKAAFSDVNTIQINPMNSKGVANNWLTCITLAEGCEVTPNQIMDALETENIESRPIWKPMNLQPVFSESPFFAHWEEGISVGEDIFNRGLCLPSDIKNSKKDMERIIKIVKSFFAK